MPFSCMNFKIFPAKKMFMAIQLQKCKSSESTLIDRNLIAVHKRAQVFPVALFLWFRSPAECSHTEGRQAWQARFFNLNKSAVFIPKHYTQIMAPSATKPITISRNFTVYQWIHLLQLRIIEQRENGWLVLSGQPNKWIRSPIPSPWNAKSLQTITIPGGHCSAFP